MAREYIELGPSPVSEDCEQLGPSYRPDIARAECGVYLRQLRRMFGQEPAGARLGIRGNHHDFGTYYEVVCYYDCDEAADYAYRLESEQPEHWDAQAARELAQARAAV